MSISRFTHVSVLMWNPPPHYPHSILLLIKYLLKFSCHRIRLLHFTDILFSFDFNYIYIYPVCAGREWRILRDSGLCVCIAFNFIIWCVLVCFYVSDCDGYGSIHWHANTQVTGSTAIFFWPIKKQTIEIICTIWMRATQKVRGVMDGKIGMRWNFITFFFVRPFFRVLAWKSMRFGRRIKSIVAIWHNKRSAVKLGCE